VDQEEIVAEIEKQFSRLDEAVANVRSAQAHLSAYRASVLSAVQRGALCGMNCNDWPIRTIGEVATRVQYGSSAKTSAAEKGIPVLRMGNIENGELVLDNLKYLPADHDEFPELFLEMGDLLFNRTNSPELVGKVAVYKGKPSPCSFASYLIRVRFIDDVLPEFASYVLNSPFGRAWVRSVVSQQVGQANVNGSKLKALQIRVPPIEAQRELVAEAERHFSLIRETEAQLAAAGRRSERLRTRLLARALSGKSEVSM
jgi:type I restriction enzyme, S subunit